VGAGLIHAERRTGMTKVIVAFRDYAKAPNKVEISIIKFVRKGNCKVRIKKQT
jgi:hypothetical protein